MAGLERSSLGPDLLASLIQNGKVKTREELTAKRAARSDFRQTGQKGRGLNGKGLHGNEMMMTAIEVSEFTTEGR